jgi:hypothetical protein
MTAVIKVNIDNSIRLLDRSCARPRTAIGYSWSFLASGFSLTENNASCILHVRSQPSCAIRTEPIAYFQGLYSVSLYDTARANNERLRSSTGSSEIHGRFQVEAATPSRCPTEVTEPEPRILAASALGGHLKQEAPSKRCQPARFEPPWRWSRDTARLRSKRCHRHTPSVASA